MYSCFFTVDRFFIQHYYNYELLGVYAILWRFGSIFQFLAIAIMDSWPIMLYHAQHELENKRLICRLMVWISCALASVCVGSLLLSYTIIKLWVPFKYHYIAIYLPLFFSSLFVLEFGRVLQSGIGLATKTNYAPIITILTLGIQVVLLKYCAFSHIWGILFANSIAFTVYAILGNYIGKKAYPNATIDTSTVNSLLILFIATITCIQYCIVCNVSWYFSWLVAIAWGWLIWLSIINEEEKNMILHKMNTISVQLRLKIL
jgi:O-antigen/teichoic acid export membrane protein